MSGEVLRHAAFTLDGAGGNPAGVVLDATDLEPSARQRIAAEVGYSETAFVDPGTEPGHAHIQYFSPLAEVAFCGHATVATAVALAQRDGIGTTTFTTSVGDVVVSTSVDDGELVATLTSVPTRSAPISRADLDPLLAALRWSGDVLDPDLPPHVAFGGNLHPVVAVRDRTVLAALDYDYPALADLMALRGWTTIQVVHRTGPRSFAVRNPFPPGGVVEDPATGAAAIAFGGYLRALGLVDEPTRVELVQGEDMGRPSRLLLDVSPNSDVVQVSGSAAPVV